MDRQFLEECLAEGLSLEQIGKRVGRTPSTISYHLKKHGLAPVNQGKHANRGALPEGRLRGLAAEGLSIRAMAEEVDRSESTVKYWLKRYGIETRRMGLRRPELEAARRSGLKHVESTCLTHGRSQFVLEGRGYYRCMSCRSERVSEWRRRAKRRLVAAAGGACARCGYADFPAALHFHHLDPAEKAFSISRGGVTRAFSELEEEASKCVLLCSRCHAEVEGGHSSLEAPPPGLEPGLLD